VSFTPLTSFAPATVVVSGSVSVSNFPASQPVTGPLTDAQLAARLPLAVDGSGVIQPISAAALPLPAGAAKDSTLTDGSQRIGGTVTVDGSAHTQPISAASLPLPDGAADNETLSELALTAIIERERLTLQ